MVGKLFLSLLIFFSISGFIVSGSEDLRPSLICGNVGDAVLDCGGSKRGVDGYGSGEWQWSHNNTNNLHEMRVWGPQSGNTFGSDAWMRNLHNYNDGEDYGINFLWSSSINAYHIDLFAIQMNDGRIPIDGEIFWPIQQFESLYVTMEAYDDEPCANPDGMQNTEPKWWSIHIDGETETATLYDGANQTGTIICQQQLNSSQPWYLRFIIMDGTSAGFPEGDNHFFLHDYSQSVINDSEKLRTNLEIADWYPQGLDVVWECNAEGGSGEYRYDYHFGDGQHQWNTERDDVFHRYPANGTYHATCIVHDQATGESEDSPVYILELGEGGGNEESSVELRIADWYPQGRDYVFICDADGFEPDSYSYWFGDGEKLLDIANDNVFHSYEEGGEYEVKCSATDGEITEEDTMVIKVE